MDSRLKAPPTTHGPGESDDFAAPRGFAAPGGGWTVARRHLLIAVSVYGLRAVLSYWRIYDPLSREHAPAAVTHRLGTEIRETIGAGRVLTLAPIFPLEDGLEIHEGFATGPFAWRTAALISPAERERFAVVSAAELTALLSERPPTAILIGVEREELELLLID